MGPKSLSKKRISHIAFLSKETDLRLRLEDYCNRLLGDDDDEAIILRLETTGANGGEELVAGGFLSPGQWILWVLYHFNSIVLNGGVAQFLADNMLLARDVSIAMHDTGMHEHRAGFDAIAATAIQVTRDFKPRSQNPIRAGNQLYTELLDAIEKDAFAQQFERDFFDGDGPNNPRSSQAFILLLVKYIEANPDQFIETS